MATILNGIMKTYLRKRFNRIESMRTNAVQLQQQLLGQLLSKASKTEWGRTFNYKSITNASDFRQEVPLQDYETHQPYIQRMMDGEADVLWPGHVKLFAKSSGTTSNRNKFIPVTKETLRQCLVPSGWDALSIYYNQRPQAQLFSEKSLIYGGSLYSYHKNPSARYGDVSAIMIDHIPKVAKPFCSPSQSIALLPDWEEKINLMARECLYENITMMSGVPTWNIVLFKKILDLTGRDNMHEVWPQLSLYLHGGVSFDPYRKQFADYLPGHMDYLEVYNASEGYFSIQDILGRDDMLLMTNNGIYYEFIPASEINQQDPPCVGLQDVECGVNYAIVVSSSAGLWRYVIGDTIEFSSINPFRIRVTGRTKQCINVFGEEVMISNANKAIAGAASSCHVAISNYTVAPIFLDMHQKGAHQWLIEFENTPTDMNHFINCLDTNLQKINADYEAKRYKGIALSSPVIEVLPKGTFNRWLKSKGKLGAQHKVPRLSNNRAFVEEILLIKDQTPLYVRQ